MMNETPVLIVGGGGAGLTDGSPGPQPIDDIRLYEPSTRPGSPLPHALVDDESGNRRALKDLVVTGRFLLIAGEGGQDRCDAAATLAAANDLPVDAVRIGHFDGDLFDPRLTWTQFRGISPKSAVLVRPDRVVAWRSVGAAAAAAATLAEALGTILGRKLRASNQNAGHTLEQTPVTA